MKLQLHDRALAVLLSLGLFLTSATQLRIPLLPIGPGEVLLAFWISASTLFSLESGVRAPKEIAALFLAFWMLAFSLLGLGLIHSLLLGKSALSLAGHDATAFIFSSVFCISLSLSMGRQVYAAYVTKAFIPLVAIALLCLIAAAFMFRRIGPFDLWYSGIRFTGLSRNPNQLALLLAPLPFFALQVYRDGGLGGARILYLAAILVFLVAGVLTLSDALLVAWVCCSGVLAFYLWLKVVFCGGGGRAGLFGFGVVIPIVFGTGFALSFEKLSTLFFDLIDSVYSDAGQGQVRLTIWRHGIEAALQSPAYGLGPGPHSGFFGPNQGYEAHNTFVDWSASSGFIGLTLYLMIVTVTILAAVRGRKAFLILSTVSLLVFSMFHYVLRQPIFWAYLVMFLSYVRAVNVSRSG